MTSRKPVRASPLSWIVLVLLVTIPLPGWASTDLGSAIDAFVQHQFPQGRVHHWVVNQTFVEDEEVVVDVKAVVTVPLRTTPVEERFLLLFVKGRLAAAQAIPLEGEPDCTPEEQA